MKCNTHTQTWPYMAPELFRWLKVPAVDASRSSDIWAFGTIMFEVLSGVKPWDDYSEAERLAAIKTGDTLDYARLSIDTPAEVRQLLEQCLSIDPKQRPRIDDVCDRLQSAFEKSAEGRFDLFLSYAWGRGEARKPLADHLFKELVDANYACIDSLCNRIH